MKVGSYDADAHQLFSAAQYAAWLCARLSSGSGTQHVSWRSHACWQDVTLYMRGCVKLGSSISLWPYRR